MNDLVAMVRAPLVAELYGAPERERHPEPWLDLLTARSRSEELLLPLGKGDRPELKTSTFDHGRALVPEGRCYLVEGARIRGRVKIVTLMLSAFDGWLLVLAPATLEPVTIKEAVGYIPLACAPWWRQWPVTERKDGILGDELAFVSWKTAHLAPAIAAEAQAIGDPAPASPGPAPAKPQVTGIFICGPRGKRGKPKPCSVCGKADAGLLCDYPLGTGKKTCDKPLCEACTHKAGKLDLCPVHASASTTTHAPGAGPQASLFGPPPAPPKKRPDPATPTLDLFGRDKS